MKSLAVYYKNIVDDYGLDISSVDRRKDILMIAIEAQRNDIFKEGFCISETAPSALEAIAIALGYK